MNPEMLKMLHGFMTSTAGAGGGGMPGGAPQAAPPMPAGPLPGAIGQPMNIAPQAPPQAAGGFQYGMPKGGILGMMQGKSAPQGILGMLQGMSKPEAPTGMPPMGSLAQAGMLAPAAGGLGGLY